MTMLKMTDLDLKGKRELIRVDFNVPMKDGKITSEKRLLASAPTLKLAAEQGARVLAISHLGQPVEGEWNEEFSLKPVAEWLSQHLGMKVRCERDWLNGVDIAPGEIVLGENVRFNRGEKKNNPELAKQMADLCDVFVMDAFATAHRAQASTCGVTEFAKVACAGPLLVAELEALGKALEHPAHPWLAIVGGSKVSTKLRVLENLLTKVDQLIVGGGIANTFLVAAGHKIGKSLYEPELVETAKKLLDRAAARGAEIIPLPTDVVVAPEFSETAPAMVKKLSEVTDDEMILDIGPETRAHLADLIGKAQTIVWNGPVGVFEIEQFSAGTAAIAKAVAQNQGFSIAGGGDTIAALEKFGLAAQVSYISTAGGAFLEYLEGAELPAVKALQNKNS